MIPSPEAMATPLGDVWYEPSRIDGAPIPVYSSMLALDAACEAYLAGNLGALTTIEIDFFKEGV